MSGSSASTSSNQQQATTTSNLNLQGGSGTTIGGDRNVITTTDAGAVAGGVSLGTDAIHMAGDVSQAAINLGQWAVSQGTDVANHGLDNARAAYETSLTFGSDALQAVQQIAAASQSNNRAIVSDAVTGFQSLAMQNSASEADKVSKVAIYGFAAIAAALVLPKLLKA